MVAPRLLTILHLRPYFRVLANPIQRVYRPSYFGVLLRYHLEILLPLPSQKLHPVPYCPPIALYGNLRQFYHVYLLRHPFKTQPVLRIVIPKPVQIFLRLAEKRVVQYAHADYPLDNVITLPFPNLSHDKF